MLSYINKNECSLNEVILYVKSHNNDFPIPLSKKVDIEDYVLKVSSLGEMVICRDKTKIVGVVFYYNNNIEEKRGFISLVSVDKNYRKGDSNSNVK